MITIKIEGLQQVLNQIGNAGKQSRFAAAVALTRTAKQVETRLQQDMASTFENPTPWVLKGTFTKSATPQTLTATVGSKDRQSLYVKEHFESGFRGQKPYELALVSIGALPSGYRAIPGSGMKIDNRGNPSRAQLRELIGSLSSRMQVAKGRGKNTKLVGYFAVMPGSLSHLAPGIYWRQGRAIKPMLVFVQQAGYRKVLDLPTIAADVVNKEFAQQFGLAFDQAMRTAR